MAKNTTPKRRPSVKQAKKSVASRAQPSVSEKPAARAQQAPASSQADYRQTSSAPKQVQGQAAYSTKGSYESRARKRYGNKKPKQRRRLGWPQLLFLLVFFAVLAAGVLFSWNQWFRFNDVQDIQGQWISSDTSSAVVIEDSKLKLVDEIAYDYTVDTGKKTIDYSFSNLTGGGYYLFSADRQKLVIFEGERPDWLHIIKVALGQAEPEDGAPSETTTILVRQADLPITIPVEEGTEDPQKEDAPGEESGETAPTEEGLPDAS